MREPADVALHHREGARLVAGHGGEHDVVRDDAQVVGVILREPVAAQVRALRLIGTAGAQVRQQHPRQRVLRLLAAGEAAVEHLLDEPDRLGVPIGLREEPGELAASAGVAVAVLVAGRGLQLHAQRLGVVHAPRVPRILEACREHAALTQSRCPVVRLHVVEHGGDLLDGERGRGTQRRGHPLELPHEVGAAVVEVGGEPLRVGVVPGEAPREGVQHHVGRAVHVGRRRLPHPGLVLQALVAELDRQGDGVRDERLLGGAPRGAVDLLDELCEALLRTCHGWSLRRMRIRRRLRRGSRPPRCRRRARRGR